MFEHLYVCQLLLSDLFVGRGMQRGSDVRRFVLVMQAAFYKSGYFVLTNSNCQDNTVVFGC